MSANFENTHSNRAFAKPKTFFWHFRPVAVMYMLIGIMPLKNILHCDSTLLRFSVFSYQFIYSLIIFIVTIIGMVNFRDPLYLIQEAINFRNNYVWRYMVILLVVIRSILSYYFCTTKSRKLVKLIQILELFDYKKSKAFKGTAWEASRRLLVWTILPILSGITLASSLAVLFMQFTKITFYNGKQTFNQQHIFVGMIGAWQMTPILLYNYFAFVIFYNFHDIKKTALNHIPIKALHKDKNICIPPDFKMILLNLNQMYFLMGDAVKYLGKMFGWYLAVDQFYIIVMFVLNLYIYFFTENIKDQNLLFCIIINAFLNFIVINVSHKISEEANNIVEFMQKLPPLILDGEDKSEIQLILSQILSSSVQVSAGGFFNINRQRIPAVLSSIATYLIVLVQFTKQGIYNNNQNETKSLSIN
nr:gustatory and odorant receptor 63a-like [Onthophagus taurus]